MQIVTEIEPLIVRPKRLLIDGKRYSLDVCEIRYERNFRQVFILDELASLELVGMGIGECSIDFPGTGRPIELLVTNLKISRDYSELRAVPRIEPIDLKFADGPVDEVSGYFSGLPADLLPGREILFSQGEINISVQVFKIDEFNLEEPGVLSGRFVAKGAVNTDDAVKLLKLLGVFLMFVRGSRVGYGHISARDASGSLLGLMRGFTKCDLITPAFSWFSMTLQDSLPNMFAAFLIANEDFTLRKVLIRSIYFYRSSNLSQVDSSELAIVSSYTALELLVSYILEDRAKWSASLAGHNIKFSDKLRATFGYCGIKDDPMTGLQDLQAFSQKKKFSDAYEVLAKIRNGIVHPKEESGINGKLLLEAWAMSQWMVEVLVFFLLQYRGEMRDRRIWGGWKGTTKPTPDFR